MSTRAIYSFDSDHGVIHVYKHHDGYPTGAADAFAAAVPYAWPLPRYEGDDFAAAFVAANKGQSPMGIGGGVRLIPQGMAPYQFAGDVAFRYQVSKDGLTVTAFEADYRDANKETFMFTCALSAFQKRAKAYEKAQG